MDRIRRTRIALGWLAVAGLTLAGSAARAQSDYPFRHNDVVVFLGDSNTAAGGYARTLERYTLLRYPARNVTFVNAGVGGDTAAGGAARLQAHVFDRGATVVVVTFGINDILWGFLATPEGRQRYLDGIRDIVVACRDRAKPVRVILNSYPLTNGAPGQTEPSPTQQFLQAMSLDAFALATSLAPGLVQTNDVFAAMWDVFVNGPKTSGLWGDRPAIGKSDGVHLSDFGHELWAYAMLRNFDLSPLISSATLGAAPPRALAAEGATLSAISGTTADFGFSRKDAALPINYGALQHASVLAWLPISTQLNQYLLRILELPAGTYAVEVDGTLLRTFTAAQLGAGVNLGPDVFDAWWPRTPWGAKSLVLTGMTTARHELQVQRGFVQGLLPADPQRATVASQLTTINQRIIAAQRDVATPYAMRYTVRRVE